MKELKTLTTEISRANTKGYETPGRYVTIIYNDWDNAQPPKKSNYIAFTNGKLYKLDKPKYFKAPGLPGYDSKTPIFDKLGNKVTLKTVKKESGFHTTWIYIWDGSLSPHDFASVATANTGPTLIGGKPGK